MLDDVGALALKTNTTWLGRISSWADEGIEVAFAKNGDYIDVFSASDGLQIGKIVDGNGDEAFEVLAYGFAPLTYPSSGAIVSSKLLDMPVIRPCGHTITEGASIVKMSDGTVGVLEDVSNYASLLVKKALTSPNYHLKKALENSGLIKAGEQAHHVIPIELLRNNQIVQDAIEAGFDFNGVVNGKGLRSVGNNPIHLGSHGTYNSAVEGLIAERILPIQQAGNYSAAKAKEVLEELADELKELMDSLPDTPVNSLFD